ncbi:TPA: hypothetical protein N0F65_008115 [Lagenidium giganteum]|uniref:Tc1-like transposase DDE domain-containing protein n=1 Tax=Lagenidium giganteum TaxID=4803 RepID=A0AAV2Z1H9_9STRA|nr:TPA: hypothetical protein N0F65_008115 [Lagenidium giganteum]
MQTFDDFMTLTRSELAQICKENKPTPVLEVAVIAREFKCDVLFLPVGYPELNPIELVWGCTSQSITLHSHLPRWRHRRTQRSMHSTAQNGNGMSDIVSQWSRCSLTRQM